MNEQLGSHNARNTLVGGVGLIALGVVLFLGKFLDIGWLMLPTISIGLIAAGILTREPGWFIPGGILAGVSGGIYLIEYTQLVPNNSDAEGGLFMLAFAAGWFSIVILTKLFSREPQWWALIPGGIMALIGAAVLGVGLASNLLQVLNYAWPLVLVGAGLLVILKRRKPQS